MTVRRGVLGMGGFSYTRPMTKEIAAHRLDVRAFAQAGGSVHGTEPLVRFPRVVQASAVGGAQSLVRWAARGEVRGESMGQSQWWLHLQVDAEVTQTCQRCLGPLQVPVAVDRWFRFVADEATATTEDETSEEDILVLAPEFNLHELVEDELLLALPYIPRHESCPVQVPMEVADPGFEDPAPRANPFAALAGLKSSNGKGQN